MRRVYSISRISARGLQTLAPGSWGYSQHSAERLPLVSEELPFALVFDANGAMLRITAVREFTPAPISEAARALQQAGVIFERNPGMQQDELGIWTAPGGGAKVAWFKDPDGNTLSISEHG